MSAEIVALWRENLVLDGAESQRRTAEVVLTIRDASSTLVGVNSVYVQDFIKADNPYYFYRVFIRPQDRRSLGLASFAGKATRLFLKGYQPTGHSHKPRGVIIVVENRKLTRPGARRMLARQGWTSYGKGPKDLMSGLRTLMVRRHGPLHYISADEPPTIAFTAILSCYTHESALSADSAHP